MGGFRSGRYGSGRPLVEALRRFDLAEHTSLKGSERPDGAIAIDISMGNLRVRAHLTETATRCGGRRLWVCCPRCGRRSRVLFIGLGRIACRRCFRLRYLSQSMDQSDRALCDHSAQADWEVVAEAGDGQEAVRKAVETNPDIAVLDYYMPLLNGIEAARQIRAHLPKTEVLIFTIQDDEKIVDLRLFETRSHHVPQDKREGLHTFAPKTAT